MDMKQEKLMRSGSWEACYNLGMGMGMGMGMEMEEDQHDDGPFHDSHWPYYLPIQNHNLHASNSSSSSSQILCPSSNFLRGNFKGEGDDNDEEEAEVEEELGAMKEMMFKIAAMQPVDIDLATIRKPRRRNVRISDDPQSIAARHRRERISEKIRILQRLVPGGTKLDTASMLDEAIRYVKFLKRQIRILQANQHQPPCINDWEKGAAAAAAPPTSYLLGGNNNHGAAGDDDPICFSPKFNIP